MSANSAAKTEPQFDERLVNAVNLVNAFQEGVVETLKIQCSCEVTADPYYVRDKDEYIDADVAGVIGMTSSKFIGAVAITFPQAVYLEIMSKMFGEEFTSVTEEIEDGAGELLNIIFGHAKSQLNSNGHDLERAIPNVVQGETFELQHLTPTPAIVLTFHTEKGSFKLEIGISA
ncbi:MAG: chemotaxis protein CheX [Bdellovibrionales bacterium]|nr:chemotaxis protein CheX [Bdellovibrionales bacterium]